MLVSLSESRELIFSLINLRDELDDESQRTQVEDIIEHTRRIHQRLVDHWIDETRE